MLRRVASLSVDLDPLRCYHEIHGLGPVPADLEDVVLHRGLPRFLALFAEYGVKATFFVVGADLDRPAGREALARAAQAGHELGNHSQTHPYDLARLPADRIAAELRACHQALMGVGARPQGFRSPGYDLSPALLDAVAAIGYRYDSSLLPSPPYYAAKAAVMAGMALLGRPTGAVLTVPQGALGPALPYRPDLRRPWRRGQAPLVELPIATTPGLRVQAIGTTLVLSEALRHYVLTAMRARPFFNLEMHGLDLLGATEDDLPLDLVARQPDLRVPLADKRRALAATLAALRAEYDFRTLDEVAIEIQREGRLPPPPAQTDCIEPERPRSERARRTWVR